MSDSGGEEVSDSGGEEITTQIETDKDSSEDSPEEDGLASTNG